jgi:hypothetical protein
MPPSSGLKGMLEAADALLHNTLGTHASPSATGQWRHDIDQLFVAAINTLPHRGRWANHSSGVPELTVAHSRTLMAARVPSVARAPTEPHAPVASLATADLWDKLERRRSGEDGCITIKRHWERRRNLDGDFSAANTTPVRQATHTPISSRSGGGCMVLAPHLQMAVWPRKF